MNPDFAEILSELTAAGAEFIVVGAFAVAAHGNPRATGDIDIWVRPTRDNAARVLQALRAFGAPLFGLSIEDLTDEQTVFQIGVAPVRIDILEGSRGSCMDPAGDRQDANAMIGWCWHPAAHGGGLWGVQGPARHGRLHPRSLT